MVISYFLVNCKKEFEKSVIIQLKTIIEIKSITQVLGPYNLVVKIQVDGPEEYKSLYRQALKIKEISNVDYITVLLVRLTQSVIVN
jgi:hypothetical protein